MHIVTSSSEDNEVDLLLGRMKSAAAPIREVLRTLHAELQACEEGEIATYIPELAKANLSGLESRSPLSMVRFSKSVIAHSSFQFSPFQSLSFTAWRSRIMASKRS